MFKLYFCTAINQSMKPGTPPLIPRRSLKQVREHGRYLHYSWAPEMTYLYQVRFFIDWPGLRGPSEITAHEIEVFLTTRARACATRAEAAAVLPDISKLEHGFCRYNNHAYPV